MLTAVVTPMFTSKFKPNVYSKPGLLNIPMFEVRVTSLVTYMFSPLIGTKFAPMCTPTMCTPCVHQHLY